MVGIRQRLAQLPSAKQFVVRTWGSLALTLGAVAIASSVTPAVAAATFSAANWQGVTTTGGTTITDSFPLTLDATTSAVPFPLSGNPEITVTAAVSGTGVGFQTGTAITEALAFRGGEAGMFFDGLLTEPALAFLSSSTADLNDPTKHCVPSVDCTDNLGFITLTFSEPVSNPVLSFSGIGGFFGYDTNRVLASWAELEFVPEDSVGAQGITRLTGTTGFVINGHSITVDSDLPSSNCVTTPTYLNGTTTPAGCGSIVVNGASVEKIVLRTYLRSTGGFRERVNPSSNPQFLYEDSQGFVFDNPANRPFIDGWSLAVSIGHTIPTVTANPQTQTIPADQPYSGTAVVAGNTDDATYKAVSAPSSGTVVMQADGSLVYTPNTGFVGTDQFDYELCHPDFASICTTSTITLIILSPEANPQTQTIPADQPYSGTAVVAGNTENATYKAVSAPSSGTVVMQADGSFVYTPNTGFVGTDQFDYELCHPDDTSICATSTITLIMVILSPEANPQTQTIPADQPYSGTAVVAGNTEDATYKAVSAPSSGTVVMQADGSFVYTPNTGFAGTDQFDYELCHPDDASICATSTITLIILSPEANPQTQTIPADQPYSGTAVVAGNTDDATYKAVSAPSSGTVVMQADGSFVYTPNTGFVGTDQFDYALCHPDDASICATSTITLITVAPVPVPTLPLYGLLALLGLLGLIGARKLRADACA